MVGTRSLKVRPHAAAAQALRQARQARKLTLGQAAEAVRLPLRHLAALEEGDFSVFPAEVYGRGAYLTYARFLGVAERLAERLAAEALTAARERVPLKVLTPFGWLTRALTPRSLIVAVVAGLGLVVGGYIVWQVQSFWRLPRLTLLDPAGVVIVDTEVTVRGVTEASARVLVNEEPVLLNDQGEFTTQLLLHPGINVLRLTAENAAGRKRVIEKHLLFPRTSG